MIRAISPTLYVHVRRPLHSISYSVLPRLVLNGEPNAKPWRLASNGLNICLLFWDVDNGNSTETILAPVSTLNRTSGKCRRYLEGEVATCSKTSNQSALCIQLAHFHVHVWACEKDSARLTAGTGIHWKPPCNPRNSLAIVLSTPQGCRPCSCGNKPTFPLRSDFQSRLSRLLFDTITTRSSFDS